MSKSTKSLATYTKTTVDYAVEVLPRLDDNVGRPSGLAEIDQIVDLSKSLQRGIVETADSPILRTIDETERKEILKANRAYVRRWFEENDPVRESLLASFDSCESSYSYTTVTGTQRWYGATLLQQCCSVWKSWNPKPHTITLPCRVIKCDDTETLRQIAIDENGRQRLSSAKFDRVETLLTVLQYYASNPDAYLMSSEQIGTACQLASGTNRTYGALAKVIARSPKRKIVERLAKSSDRFRRGMEQIRGTKIGSTTLSALSIDRLVSNAARAVLSNVAKTLDTLQPAAFDSRVEKLLVGLHEKQVKAGDKTLEQWESRIASVTSEPSDEPAETVEAATIVKWGKLAPTIVDDGLRTLVSAIADNNPTDIVAEVKKLDARLTN